MKHYLDIPKPWTALLAGLLAFASHGGHAQGASFDGAYKTAHSSGNGAAVDGQGNTILASAEYDSTPDGLRTLSLLVKLSPEGTQLWSRTNALPVYQFASDSAGGIYGAGAALRWPDGDDRLDAEGIATEGTGGLYLARMAADGTIQWVRRFGPDILAPKLRFCFDSAGSFYIVWTGRSDMPEGREFTVAKYDPTGQEVWSRRVSVSHYLGDSVLAATPDGGLLVGGTVYDSNQSPMLQLGEATLSTSDYLFGFVLKLDPNGNLLWVVQPEGARRIRSLVSDRWGNAYTAYEMSESNPGVAKYSPIGEQLWARQGVNLGTVCCSIPPNVALDDEGNCYFTGTFWSSNTGKIQFGDVVLSTIGQAEMFLVKYSSSGDLLWATQSQGMDPKNNVGNRYSDTRVSAILPNPSGGFVVTGTLLGTVRFGDKQLVGPGRSGPSETFVVQFSDPPPPLPVLEVARSDQGLVLSWPAAANEFRLQATETLSAATAWNPLPAVPVLAGDRYTVNVPVEQAPQFFRLVKP